jgi:hypothetical protein
VDAASEGRRPGPWVTFRVRVFALALPAVVYLLLISLQWRRSTRSLISRRRLTAIAAAAAANAVGA